MVSAPFLFYSIIAILILRQNYKFHSSHLQTQRRNLHVTNVHVCSCLNNT
jgi:hypothetical protein